MAVTTDYNVEYDRHNIILVEGDTINLTYSVYLNDVLYDMTGMRLDIEIKDEDDTVILALSTHGTSPAITISTTSFTVVSTGIGTTGFYWYDVQLTNGSYIYTICSGKIKVVKEITD